MSKTRDAFWVLALLVFFASACRKADSAGTNHGKIRTRSSILTQSNGTTTTDSLLLTYDSRGRLSSTNNAPAGIGVSYAYQADSVVLSFRFSNGQFFNEAYALNAQGYATSAPNNVTYTYDAQGYRLSQAVYLLPVNDTTRYTYLNGNLISTIGYSWQNETLFTDTTLYTYNTGVTENRNSIPQFFGAGNTNLVASEIILRHGQTETISYTYSFDSYGRVTNETRQASGATINGMSSQLTNYTYY